MAAASDHGVSRRLGVRARSGYGGADVACGHDVVRVRALWSQTVSSSHFQIEFSPKFKTKVHKTLNPKVAQQLTLYKFAKGSRGFSSLDLA
jgi:hypothetical protein